jgi:hypothetical protein
MVLWYFRVLSADPESSTQTVSADTHVLLANLIRDTVFTSGVSNAAEERL